jgi:nucleoid DNA-binding protein
MASKKTAKAKTKSELMSEIASGAGLTKVQVAAVFDSLSKVVQAELKAGRPVAVAGLVKITQTHKPATAARPGRNPFTGAEIMIKAKPARRVVKVRALKGLKDMV